MASMRLAAEFSKAVKKRNILFAVFSVGLVLVFLRDLQQLILFSFDHQHYSHMVLIPLVSLYLFWINRSDIFSKVQYSTRAGAIFLAAGMGSCLVAINWGHQLSPNDYHALMMSSFLILFLGGFISCYGVSSVRAASFPFLFLLFTIPIPSPLLDRVVYGLQWGSAWATFWLFKLTDVPFFREGFIFALPGLTIEVARECSGIRSSLVLVICGFLAGHRYLRDFWQKGFLMLAIIPLAIFKNGIRIVTLSLLSIYVDEDFMTGTLHQRGGVLFFLLALILMVFLLWMLRRVGELKGSRGNEDLLTEESPG